MAHIIILYLIISCSIGLPAMTVLMTAFFKSREKVLKYIFFFLFMATLHLAFVTYVAYRYVNTFSGYTSYGDLINQALLSSSIIVLPVSLNEWLKVRYRKTINLIFFGLFLTSLGLLVGPIFLGVLAKGIYVSSLPGGKVVLTTLGLTYAYVLLITLKNFSNIIDSRERVFYILSLICLTIELSQVLFPIFRIFPENMVLYAAIYFFWNLALLKYTISNFLLNSLSDDSIKAIIDKLALTEREKEITVLLVQGRLNQEIGTQLFISEDTVKTHIKNIYKKLGVKNRIQLFNSLKEKK